MVERISLFFSLGSQYYEYYQYEAIMEFQYLCAHGITYAHWK